METVIGGGGKRVGGGCSFRWGVVRRVGSDYGDPYYGRGGRITTTRVPARGIFLVVYLKQGLGGIGLTGVGSDGKRVTKRGRPVRSPFPNPYLFSLALAFERESARAQRWDRMMRRSFSVPGGHGARGDEYHIGRPNVFWTVQIYLGNFLVENYQNTSSPNRFGPFKIRLDSRDACTAPRGPFPSVTEKFLNDEVSNCRMTRSAYKYNQKKFADRRKTRSKFLELQKQRQGDGKPQQWRRQKKEKIKKKMLKPVRVNTLTGRDRYVRDFTPEEREVYNKRVRESEGFDVGEIPNEVILNPVIREIPLDPRCSIIVYSTTSSKTALRDYNKDNHTKYQFVKLVRVCYRLAMGNMYYITFQAKQNGITRNFQARVREFLGMHIEFCREEKKPNLTEGSGETSQQS